MLLKNIVLIVSLFTITSLQVFAFQSADNEIDREKPENSLTVSVDKFECFQTLKCLKHENPFPKSNLDKINLNQNRSEKYVIEGSSKNETMHAVYNQYGQLVKSTVIQRNIALPKAIYKVLATGQFRDWIVIGNELEIQNFNKNRMVYKVILQKEDEIRVEYFDNNGQIKNRLL